MTGPSLRIVVYPHNLEVGGSQLNAIELAEAVRDLGHEVIVYGPDGDLVAEVRRRALEMIVAPGRVFTPSPRSASRLTRLVRRRNIDVVHTYEDTTLLDAMYGPGWLLGTPVLSTVLEMQVPFYLPRSVPMVVGTRDLVDLERRRRPEVHLMVPPIDTQLNQPGRAPRPMEWGGASLREHVGIRDDERVVVVVSRLANHLKLDGLIRAISAMPRVNETVPARLVIVGDGPERGQLTAHANAVNIAYGHTLVNLVGQVMDPRAAYDGADVVLGMGGSILRAMAFAKPCIVLGEHGFAAPVTEQTRPLFEQQGWYGIGAWAPRPEALPSLIEEILISPDEARRRGELARRIVVEGYGLHAAAVGLVELYRSLVQRHTRPMHRAIDATGVTQDLVKLRAALMLERMGLRGGRA